MKSHTANTTAVSVAVIALFNGTTPALGKDFSQNGSFPPIKIEWPANAPSDLGQLAVTSPATPSTSAAIPKDPWEVLLGLKEGWDGASGSPVSPDAVAHAKAFLAAIAFLGIDFSPFADPDGSVGLEADKPGKNALLLVDPSGQLTYVISDGMEVHRGDNITTRKMRDLLAYLY